MNHREIFGLVDTDPDEAHRQCMVLLDKNPDDHAALFLCGAIYAKAERFGLAYNVFKRVCELQPKRPEAWNNLGMSLEGMHLESRAREAFMKAWNGDPKNASYAANVAVTYLGEQNWQKAREWASKALKIDPENSGANTTHGMSSLAVGDWDAGWKGMAYAVGQKFRKENQYQDEGRWTGEPGTVVFYGEQGLGDEIMYSSCIPDAVKDNTVILECDSRLEGLFKRSFPGVHVYGTRRQEVCPWIEDHKIDARCAIGQMPQFFRKSPEDCPGTPYLVADPERRLQWRALFDSWGTKPKIGICWSGGSKHNNPEARNMGLESFRGLIEKYDADWVSLQYKDPTEEIAATGFPVRHFKRACETSDYDDTAALVAELDLVIGVHTSAHHLAGALGVPGLILVPEKSIWIYASETMPWYSSAKLVKKRGEWTKTLEGLADDPFVQRLRP